MEGRGWDEVKFVDVFVTQTPLAMAASLSSAGTGSGLGPTKLFLFLMEASPPWSHWAQTLLGLSSARPGCSRCGVFFAESLSQVI